MKLIDTLVPDIKQLFAAPHVCNQENLNFLSSELAKIVASRLNPEQNRVPTLRMSNLGNKCDRQLHYSINSAEQGEQLPFEAKMKFLYGDILELLLLFLSKEAGHKVEGTQDTLEIEGVQGHRDAVIDGVTVDVKSASTYSFRKFESHLTRDNDDFGYIDQLGAYQYAGQSDPIVTDISRAAFLVIDKTLGHICLDIHKKTDLDYSQLVVNKQNMLSKEEPPPRGFSDEEMGKSGNRKLSTRCGYCNFKNKCWPTLRTFIYSTGPVYLSKVTKEPNVPEAKKSSSSKEKEERVMEA